MIKVRVYLQYFVAVILIIVFLSGVFPPILMQFTGILPYLHNWVIFERLILVFLVWCLVIIFYLLVSTDKQKKSVLSTIQYSFKNWVISFFGVLLFVYSGAWLSANSLGTLVKIFPNEPYSAQMEVVNVKTQGSKYKSVNLDLKSNADGEIYYLTLSKQLFNYPKFNIGDKLILKGKQNWFGVYVEEFQQA